MGKRSEKIIKIRINMLTQRKIYNNIYNSKLREFTITRSAEKASRLANMFAVKHTWELFNEQYIKCRR